MQRMQDNYVDRIGEGLEFESMQREEDEDTKVRKRCLTRGSFAEV